MQNVSLVGCTGEGSPTGVLHEYAGSVSFSGCDMTNTTEAWNIAANSPEKIFAACAPSTIDRFQWNPIVSDSSGNEATLTINERRYYLDGVYCNIHLDMDVTNLSGLNQTDNLRISGFPFQGKIVNDRIPFFMTAKGVATDNGGQYGVYQRVPGNSDVVVLSMDAAGVETTALYSEVSEGARLRFSFRYRV